MTLEREGHFKSLSAVSQVYEIPGPIHVDLGNRFRNTQTVEGSHAEPKMRLRLGRGLRRHNLQGVMDFEDFIRNRTDGTPQDILKTLAQLHSSTWLSSTTMFTELL